MWEIQKAIELKKRLVAAKTDSINNSPSVMQRGGVSWSMMFNFDSVKKAMRGRMTRRSRDFHVRETHLPVSIVCSIFPGSTCSSRLLNLIACVCAGPAPG